MGHRGIIMLSTTSKSSSLYVGAQVPLRARTTVHGEALTASQNWILKTVAVISASSCHPAIALVDDRLAGEGTGKALGINDPVLGWVIVGVITTVWALYYTATKELGGQREEDGLGL